MHSPDIAGYDGAQPIEGTKVEVQTILFPIDLGAIALPEFQRGYMQDNNMVRGLMDSLYRRHPVGGLLVWVTKTETATARGDGPLAQGSVELLLDGQQRITNALRHHSRQAPEILRRCPAQTFHRALHFHLEDQVFEFYEPHEDEERPTVD